MTSNQEKYAEAASDRGAVGDVAGHRPGRFAGKVAIVSGAARGQGRAQALRLGAEGAKVVVADVRDDGELVAEAIRERGGSALFARLDVSDAGEWESVVRRAEESFGSLDLLVNNAGISVGHAIDATSDQVWAQVVAVNQTGVFYGLRAGVAAMRRSGGGAIVNISSSYGLASGPAFGAYQATKRAVIGLTESAAATYAADGIRVNCVCPGLVFTDMTDKATEAQLAALVRAIPAGRGADPDEIASGVLFLLSDEASYVNGAKLAIDGAMTINTHTFVNAG